MAHNYGIEYETGYDMHRDPQMQNASTEIGPCLVCGELFPVAELERNDGLCLPCFYKSLEPDPEDGEGFEADEEQAGRLPALQENGEGGGDDGGKG